MISAVRHDNDGASYLVELNKQDPQIFSSTDMCAKWPEETIHFLEMSITYIPGASEENNCDTISDQMTKSGIGKPQRVLCKF